MDPVNVTADATEFTSNAYLVAGDRTALVDVGAMPGVADVVAGHVDDVDVVAITHQHGDHVGELPAVRSRFDPAVVAHGDLPGRTRGLADGAELRLGDDTYEVVYTPGHADDHVAFVGDRWLFSGDVVVYNDGAFEAGSFGRTDRPGRSREQLIESLRTLLERTPDSVEGLYAGHGDVFTEERDGDSVHDVIERALSRAERREPKYSDD